MPVNVCFIFFNEMTQTFSLLQVCYLPSSVCGKTKPPVLLHRPGEKLTGQPGVPATSVLLITSADWNRLKGERLLVSLTFGMESYSTEPK